MRIPGEWRNFYVGREVNREGLKGVVKSFTLKWGHADTELADTHGVAVERIYRVDWADKTCTNESDKILLGIATQRFAEESWVNNVVLYLQKHNWEGYQDSVDVLKQRAEKYQRNLLRKSQLECKSAVIKGTGSTGKRKTLAQNRDAAKKERPTARADKKIGASGGSRKITDLNERLARRNAEKLTPSRTEGSTKAAGTARAALLASAAAAATEELDRGASNSPGEQATPCLSQPAVTSPGTSCGIPPTAHLSSKKHSLEPQAQVLPAAANGVGSGCKRRLPLGADCGEKAASATSSKLPPAIHKRGPDTSFHTEAHAAATVQATQVGCFPSDPPTAPGCRPDEIAEPLWDDRSYTYSQLDGHVIYKYNLRAGPDKELWRIYSRDVIIRDDHCYNPARDMLCREWKLEHQEDAEYTVERVVGERVHPKAGKQYLIKWQDYELDLADDNWLPVSALKKARAVLKDWHGKHKQSFQEVAAYFCD